MECRDVERLIDAYLDRELSAESAHEVESHLASCPTCRGRYGGMVSLLTSTGEVDVPEGLRDRIMAGVRDQSMSPGSSPATARQAARRLRFGWWAWTGAIAASIAFFAFGWFSSDLWNNGQPLPGPIVERGQAREVTVVLSPWVLSSWAQATALRTPGGPMFFLAQATATEMMTASFFDDTPVERCGPPIDPGMLLDDDSALPQIPIPWPVRSPLGV